MYIYCFANIDNIILNDANFGGSFCCPGFGMDGNRTRWHYSGSYYWVNNSILNQKQFLFRRGLEYYVSEKFPGTCCPTKEKCLTFLDFPDANNANLYETRCIDSFSMLTNALNHKYDCENNQQTLPLMQPLRECPPTPTITTTIPSNNNDNIIHHSTMFKNHRIMGGKR
jgi:hypothetical protein